MMKPILLVSALALAAPVLAQSTNTGTGTGTTAGSTSQTNAGAGTSTNDDVGAVGGNTVNSQNTMQTPVGDENDDAAVDHSAMGHGSTAGTMGQSDTTGQSGTVGQSGTTATGGTMSGTGTSQGTMGTGGMTGQTSAANWNNGSSTSLQPGNNNPERDARGIAVISAPAFVPGGWNGMAGSAMGGPLLEPGTGAAAGAQSYPACSRTVTDRCTQTYERGRSG